MGNKYRIIDELLKEFPKKDIDTFIDVFAGSGIVGLSYKIPDKIFLNDNDLWLTKLLEYLLNNDKKKIINSIEEVVNKYKLPTSKKDYKNEFNKLRSHFNKNKDNIVEFFVLILFSFNQQIRFNSKNEYNVPIGKFYWNEYHRNKIEKYIDNTKNRNISIRSMNFDDFVKDISKEIINKNKTLFYFDPPYLISNAVYNSGWNEIEEKKLIDILEWLTKENYKWVLSNVIESKGKENKLLKEFINKYKNKIEIKELVNVNYKNSNYQRKNKNFNDVEVLLKRL